LNTEELLKHRMLKFRKLGGFKDGIPIDPKKKRNMKKRDIPPAKISVDPKEKRNMKTRDLPPAKISDSELEVQIEKLKQQILKSSSEPPKLNLYETIKKLEDQLERDVDQELSEAAKALGLTKSLSKLRDEFSKASSDDQPTDPLLKGKIEKLKADFNRRLSAAPNASKLKKKHGMLRELTKVKLLLSDRNKQELKKKFDDVMNNNPRIKELQSEIQRLSASSASDLDDELKKKIIEFNKEVDLQLANAVKSIELDDVEFVKPGREPKIEELKKDVIKEIDVLANSSPEIKRMIEQLKVEVAKAGGTPNSESKNRIDALRQQITQSLAEALGSSSLKKKYENLVSGTSGDESLKAGNGLTDDELREKVGANRSFS